MQFDATVVRPGQAATAQAAGLHPEIAPILLHHDVRGHLGRPKERVFAGIDGESFRDPLPVRGVVVVPPGLELFQFDEVRPVPVHLVGGHVGEGALRAGPPGGFQQVEGADGVDVEIVKGTGGGEVVAGLGGGVDDGRRLKLGDELQDLFTVADIQLVVFEVLIIFFQPLLVPAGVAAGPEEVGPLVVVDPVNLRPLPGEVADHLRTDQTRRSSDEELHSKTARLCVTFTFTRLSSWSSPAVNVIVNVNDNS